MGRADSAHSASAVEVTVRTLARSADEDLVGRADALFAVPLGASGTYLDAHGAELSVAGGASAGVVIANVSVGLVLRGLVEDEDNKKREKDELH